MVKGYEITSEMTKNGEKKRETSGTVGQLTAAKKLERGGVRSLNAQLELPRSVTPAFEFLIYQKIFQRAAAPSVTGAIVSVMSEEHR